MSQLNESGKNILVRTLQRRVLEYLDNLDPSQIKVYDKDDGRYNIIKYTTLPKGTRLRFRSHFWIGYLDNRPIWADYSELLGKESFLNGDKDYSKGMEHYFGRYMNTIELLHDMTIIHFPVNYNLVTAPNVSRYVNKNNNRTRRLINRNKRTLRIERPLDFTAEMEGIVRALCVKKTREKYKKTAELLKNHNVSLCRDGYTLDFFYRFAGADAKKFKEIQNRLWSKMAGWREICLTNVTPRTVRLVESVYKPVE